MARMYFTEEAVIKKYKSWRQLTLSYFVNIISKKSLSSTGMKAGTSKSTMRSHDAGVSAYFELLSESPIEIQK